MKCEWKQIRIGDLGLVITGKTPQTKNAKYWGGHRLFITPKDLQRTKHIFQTERIITDAGLESVKGCKLPARAVCVSCIDNIGYVGMTTQDCISNQQINSIVVNKDYDADYVYYVMRGLWPLFKKYEGSSTALSILNKSQFSNIRVRVVTDIKVQRRIAAILSSLDDKIELNNKINANLEQQAQALFKAWFVDNPDVSLWQEGTFADLVERAVGGDWGKDLPSGNNTEMVYCIRGADIPEVRVGNKGKMPTRYILPKNYAAKKLMDGDIVVEISGGSPTQSTGRAAVVSAALLS